MNGMHSIRAARTVAAALVFVAVAGCGRDRSSNVPPGEARIFLKAGPSTASGDSRRGGAGATDASGPVSADEARRRAIVVRLIEGYKKAKDEDARLQALDRMRAMKDSGAELVPILDDACEDSSTLVRQLAVEIRAVVAPGSARAILERKLKDPEPDVRKAAVEGFAKLPDADIFASLLKLLDIEKEPPVQAAVMHAFEERAPAALIPELVKRFDGVDFVAMHAAVRYLMKYPAEAKPHVEKIAYYLDRNDTDLRLQAARALGDLGVKSKPVLLALCRALSDSEPPVRAAANLALQAITREDFMYDADAAPERRDAAQAKWRAYIDGS